MPRRYLNDNVVRVLVRQTILGGKSKTTTETEMNMAELRRWLKKHVPLGELRRSIINRLYKSGHALWIDNNGLLKREFEFLRITRLEFL